MNGATQTFRRPSVAINPSHSRDTSQPASATTPTAGAYTQQMSNYPSSALRNGAGHDTRYSKDQLLNLYKAQRDSGALNKNVADYFAADWNPGTETSPVNGAWGRREDSKDNPSGPEVCWDHDGQMEPLGLLDMTEDEKEVSFLPPLFSAFSPASLVLFSPAPHRWLVTPAYAPLLFCAR